MSTFTQILYHIVFSSKNRVPAMKPEGRNELFQYITGILKNKKCHLYRINGIEDHLHILTHLHPSVPLAALVKDIKLASNKWINEKKLFRNFPGWQVGYGAFTCSFRDKDVLINYIKNQETHHHKKTFLDEYKELLTEHWIEFDERYLL